jgi:hypothetical protein
MNEKLSRLRGAALGGQRASNLEIRLNIFEPF